MKKSFLILMLMLGMHSFAADIIITKNGESINAKILEVSESEIKYKKENNLNGPTFIVSTTNVASIIYDGTKKDKTSDLIVTGVDDVIEAKIIEINETDVKYKKISNLNGPTFSLGKDKISSVLFANGELQLFSQPVAKVPEAAPATTENSTTAQKSSCKLKFNPQPSDNYVWGLTFGYVSKQIKSNGYTFGYGEVYLDEGKSFTPALRFGITANPNIKYGIGIRTGLFLEYAHDSYKEHSYEKYDLHDITLSLPLQVSYRYEIIKNLSVMFYTGPIFEFGALLQVNSKYRGETYKSENFYKYEGMLLAGDDEEKYSGFNCLWGIGAAIQWSRLRLDVGGDFGMVKRVPVDESVFTNKPVYVTLTTFF